MVRPLCERQGSRCGCVLRTQRTLDEYAWDYIEKDLEPFVIYDNYDPKEMKRLQKEEEEVYNSLMETDFRREVDGKILSQIMHVGDKYGRYFHPVGHYGVKSIQKAGEYHKLDVPLDGEWAYGYNWSDIH